MRSVQWLFLVSAALFVCGIGFVVVGARTSRQAPPPAERVVIVPVASVKQIMRGIVGPSAKVVFESVSVTVSEKGVEEKAPRDEEEWTAVGTSAAALAEGGNLMLLDGRAVDQGDWVKMSRALVDAAKKSLQAVEAKSADGLLAVGEEVNLTCDNCHRRYQRN